MPLLKVWPVISGAWILLSSNALCLSPISGRRRGGHPFGPLPHLLLALCHVQGRVFWPWPLHPAPVLSFACLCPAIQACEGVSSLNRGSESITQQTIYEISPCDIAPLQLNAHFHPRVRPLEFAVLILGSSPEDSQRCCLLWWLGCDGCIPTSLECSIHNGTASPKEAAGHLRALCCCCPALVQDWSRLTRISIHSK